MQSIGAMTRNKVLNSLGTTQNSANVQIIHVYKDSLETEERERYTTIQSGLLKNQSSNSNQNNKVVYTDSLEPKESTQKQFLMQFRKGLENYKDGDTHFYVLRTDPESAYLKTEQEEKAQNKETFSFHNTLHNSDRQKKK